MYLTAKTIGVNTNYSLSSSSTYDSNDFGGPSFTNSDSGANLAGGQDAGLYPGVIYSYDLTYAPDGDLLAGNDSVNGNWTYGYDDFNQLISSSQNNGAVAYNYGYDRFGNRWNQTVTAGSGSSSSLSFNASNRIMPGNGVAYDAAGNVINDGWHSYSYDAEERISQVDGGTTATYVYDAEGRRVRKTTSSGSVDYLYDLAGHEITEMSSSGAWNRGEVYAAGLHLATYAHGTTYFDHADWLGTERVRSTMAEASCETTKSLPFGDGMTTSGNCDPSPMHFTGKQRDSETASVLGGTNGLDYFGARYDASSVGRFMTPDWSAQIEPVPYAKLGDPQSLNLYSYVQNNPVTSVDPDGHDCSEASNGLGCNEPSPEQQNSEFWKEYLQSFPWLQNICNCIAADSAQQNHQSNQDQNQPNQPIQMSGGKGGGQGKGERKFTDKPEYKPQPAKPPKGWRQLPNGRWQYRDPQTGKKVTKGPNWRPDWSPATTRKVAIGLGVAGTAALIIKIAAEACALGACYP